MFDFCLATFQYMCIATISATTQLLQSVVLVCTRWNQRWHLAVPFKCVEINRTCYDSLLYSWQKILFIFYQNLFWCDISKLFYDNSMYTFEYKCLLTNTSMYVLIEYYMNIY